MAHACPVGRSIAAAPATGSVLAFEQQLDYLRRNFPRALIERVLAVEAEEMRAA